MNYDTLPQKTRKLLVIYIQSCPNDDQFALLLNTCVHTRTHVCICTVARRTSSHGQCCICTNSLMQSASKAARFGSDAIHACPAEWLCTVLQCVLRMRWSHNRFTEHWQVLHTGWVTRNSRCIEPTEVYMLQTTEDALCYAFLPASSVFPARYRVGILVVAPSPHMAGYGHAHLFLAIYIPVSKWSGPRPYKPYKGHLEGVPQPDP